MKELIPIFIICIILLGSFSAIGVNQTDSLYFEIKEIINITNPEINLVDNNYISLSYPIAYHSLKKTGKPQPQ